VNKTLHILLIGTLTWLLVWSCADDDTCVTVSNPLVNVGFYRTTSGVEADTTLSFFCADGLVENDSNLYDSVSVNGLALPLSQLADTCSFLFRYSQVDTLYRFPDTVYTRPGDTLWKYKTDTLYFYDKLTFHYRRQLHLINEACGFQYFFHIDSVQTTDTLITSIRIVLPDIKPTDEEHVKIFF